MNAPAIREAGLPSLAMDEAELLAVLQSSLYPGAKPGSVRMVVNYCRAQSLDPMQKPVHIVPMSVKNGDNYEMRDVVMPGIGLYRTTAARTGQHAGTSEPEFGPDVVRKWGDLELTFPSWCKVTVYRRLASGEVVAFTARELWLENYATTKRDSTVPNAMWKKRPYGQLGKCAEAQALRKAFPEVGAQPTAEEMEGRTLDDADVIDGTSTDKPAVAEPRSRSGATVHTVYPSGGPKDAPNPAVAEGGKVHGGDAAPAAAGTPAPAPAPAPAAEDTGELATDGEKAFVKRKLAALGQDPTAFLAEHGGIKLETLTKAQFASVKSAIAKAGG